MFNGIIYNTGIVEKVLRGNKSLDITLSTKLLIKKNEVGNSICCDGVCLTINKINKKLVSFHLSNETLKRTNFKYIKEGNSINIEKSLEKRKKVSGHYVQGHIDSVGKIKKILIVDKTWIVTFKIANIYKKYLMDKASIAVNGVSLTISKVYKNQFEVNIIPHTLKLTNLTKLKKGNSVNLEFDIFGKYLLNLKK